MTRLPHYRRSLLCGVVACCAVLPARANEDAAWQQLGTKVETLRVELDSLITRANRNGITTDYASVSRQVITAFQAAARHDHENVERVREIFQSFGYYSKTDPGEADRLASNELNACIKVAEHAMAELRSQLDRGIKLSAPPDLSKGTMKLGPGYYQLDGRTVFPGTLTWMPDDEDYLRAFGRMGGGYYQLSKLRKDGTISGRTLERNIASAREQHSRHMAPFTFFIGHSPAGWMTDKHPEISDGARHFTKYDIDSPLIRAWLERLFAGMLPEWSNACGDLPRMHLLANEPHFATQKRGWKADNGVSAHTMRKYRAWIAAKYKEVGALNAAHGTSVENLAGVTVDLPIDPKLRGGPVWYDWCRFNMDRVNDWFAFLKRQVQTHDPAGSPVTIKLIGHTLGGHLRDQGMDIETLTKLQDISGADLRAMPRDATVYGRHEEGLDPETGWVSRYAYDWTDQSMALDFSKSICPDKLFYDSEWHGLGAVGWRHFNLDREYVRSALWLAFSHGMGAIQPWLWGRKVDGALSPGADHIGELSTQPVALDAFGRTLKELNAHAGHVASAVPKERNFMIFYCEEAAIQSEQYMEGIKQLYEALKLLNLRVGFTTPAEAARLDPAVQTMIVPPTEFISAGSLAAIQAFQQAAGRIVMVGAEKSFLKTELGAPRPDHPVKDSFASVPLDTAIRLVAALDATLASIKPRPPMDLVITDPAGARAWGVIISQSAAPKTGTISILLNNVSKDPRVVILKPREKQAGEFIDVITGLPVPSRLVMRPCDVRVVHFADSR